MKLVRVRHDGQIKFGTLEGDTVLALEGNPLAGATPGKPLGKLDALELLAPCDSRKVIAAAINYHGATDWQPGMTEPLFFLKSPTSLCGPRDQIVSHFADVPSWGEAELAIVVGRRLCRASEAEARAGIFGYTIANDASCENTGTRDHHLARSKAADSFCPVGPYIDTNYDPTNKMVQGFHNGKLVRSGSTRDLFWGPVRILQELSQWITLEPWDLILTGSPPLQGPLTYFEDGDHFTANVEGFPSLETDFRQAVPLDRKAIARFYSSSEVSL